MCRCVACAVLMVWIGSLAHEVLAHAEVVVLTGHYEQGVSELVCSVDVEG